MHTLSVENAIAALTARDFARAASMLQSLCRISPHDAQLHQAYGAALCELRKFDDALAMLTTFDEQTASATFATTRRQLHTHCARHALTSGDHASAQTHITHGLALDARDIDLLLLSGLLAERRGDNAGALQHLRAAHALAPARADVRVQLGVALTHAGELSDALAMFADDLAQSTELRAFAANNRASVLLTSGRIAEGRVALELAAQLAPDNAATHHNRLLASHYDPALTHAERAALHRAWGARFPTETLATSPPSRAASHTIRIGYLSPDFREHACAFFLWPIIAGHDRTAFEIFCYYNHARTDAWTTRFRNTGVQWREVAHLDDDALTAQIRADALDILVDCAGHSEGNRLAVFARKPAPIQITMIGYPNTTGLSQIDYRIVDAWTDPDGDTPWHSERLIRLPTGFNCYAPPDDAPPVNPLPALASGQITFGSCNNLPKLNAEVLETWIAILHTIPNARLILKTKYFSDPHLAARYLAYFTNAGIAATRVELRGWSPQRAHHLSVYHACDIALDAFPYNGTTTTCEALWMGVPVLALRGTAHVARASCSILERAQLATYITTTRAAYIAAAVQHAHDLPALAATRATLRERIRPSALCSAGPYVAALESAYRAMVRAEPSR